jgi:hypothetical protein
VIAKEKKTATELKTLIMSEIRQHPEFNNITNVVIIKPPQRSVDDPNWDFQWSMSGPQIAPQQASEIAEQFRRKYDLG